MTIPNWLQGKLIAAAGPFGRIPAEVRQQIYDELKGDNEATDILFHGKVVKPLYQIYPRVEDRPAAYIDLAQTTLLMSVEMDVVKGDEHYPAITFRLRAHFRGPVARLGGDVFTMDDYAPFKHIRKLTMEILLTHKIEGPQIEDTMKNISGAINAMPERQTLGIVIHFTHCPETNNFALLMRYLGEVRVPDYRIALAGLECLPNSRKIFDLYYDIVVGPADVTDCTDYGGWDWMSMAYDEENEDGWTGGFPDF